MAILGQDEEVPSTYLRNFLCSKSTFPTFVLWSKVSEENFSISLSVKGVQFSALYKAIGSINVWKMRREVLTGRLNRAIAWKIGLIALLAFSQRVFMACFTVPLALTSNPRHSGPKLAFGTHLVGDGDPLSETISKSVQISVLMWQIYVDRFSDAIKGSRERPSAGLCEKRAWSRAGPRPVTKKWYFWPHGVLQMCTLWPTVGCSNDRSKNCST